MYVNPQNVSTRNYTSIIKTCAAIYWLHIYMDFKLVIAKKQQGQTEYNNFIIYSNN